MYPRFRRDRKGNLSITDSDLARRAKNEWHPSQPFSEIENEAKEKVRQRGGNLSDRKDVLGEYVLNFGKYRNKSFRWLLENSPGYMGYLITGMLHEKGARAYTCSQSQQSVKDALMEYVLLFPEARELAQRKIQASGDTVAQREWQKAMKGKDTPPQTQASLTPTHPSRFSSLFVGRQLSPQQLRCRVGQLLHPQCSPDVTGRRRHDTGSGGDSDTELVSCLELVESNITASQQSSGSSGNISQILTPTKVKKPLFQETGKKLTPVPKSPAVCSGRVSPQPLRIQLPSTIELPPATTSQSKSGSTDSVQSEPLMTELPSTIKLPPATTSQSESCSADRVQSEPLTTVLPLRIGLPPASTSQPESSSAEPLLFAGWKNTIPKVDHQWISKLFFGLNSKVMLEFRHERVTQLWYYPPQPSVSVNIRNKVDRYFTHRLFMWMPLSLWSVRLICPLLDKENQPCNGGLRRAGIHQKTRMVLDVDSYYIIAAEYLQCSKCTRKMISWAHNVVNQLDRDRQLLFPCILTAKYACDRKIVELLRNRGLGNSSSMIQKQLQESHGECYLRNTHHYLSGCKSFKAAQVRGLIDNIRFEEPPAITPIPGHRWLMKVYQLDVLQRLDFIKASITSLFGNVLKLDSTKKITKKLAGKSAKTAMWATNVGNEYGQVIMTVLTANEGQGLAEMISGLCQRYHGAGMPAPRLLYVDRDCCGNACISKYFSWPFLLVRLDIWHFMRRLSTGCTTDAHPLYGTFMRRLSHCIFRWEEEDVRLLKKAKRAQMIQQHIPAPSDADVTRHIKSDELSLHCRRVTRGTMETQRLISELIKSMDGDQGLDILGVPLFDSVKIQEIWSQQSKHVGCLQDPDGVQLYTRVGTIKKGGVELPTYRCARGSTSLESFHLHMNRFIPGTLASAVNFQVYLLDGVQRWNQDRQKEAVIGQDNTSPLSYDGVMQHSVNQLALEVLGREVCPNLTVPGKYTGELIGLEYLYSQSTGATVQYQERVKEIEEDTQQDEDVAEEDEGFEDAGDVQDLTIPELEPDIPMAPPACGRPLLSLPTDEEYRQMTKDTDYGESEPQQELSTVSPPENLSEEPVHDESDIGPDNIPGYAQVIKIATFLVGLREQDTGLTTSQADQLILLWGGLTDYDKTRTRFPQRFAASPGSGRFRSPKKQVALGVTSIERAILGPNSTRANWPDCNRYVEALVEKLLEAYPSDKRSKQTNTHISRWTLIKEAYGRIQSLVLNNVRVMKETAIQLPSLNNKTIQQWFNKKGKSRDLQILLQGIEVPQASMTGSGAPEPKVKPVALPSGHTEEFQFSHPPDTAGTAKLKIRKRKLPQQMMSERPILPMPPKTSDNFPIILSPSTFIQTEAPTVQLETVLHTKKRKSGLELGPKRKYIRTATSVKCGKCGENRDPPTHQQYMGYRYCGNLDQIPFQQWRANLQAQGVARKKHDK